MSHFSDPFLIYEFLLLLHRSLSGKLVDGDNDSLYGILPPSPPSKLKRQAASEENPSRKQLDEVSKPELELSENPLKKRTKNEEEEQTKRTAVPKVKKEKTKATKEGGVQMTKKETKENSSTKEESKANDATAKLSNEDTANGHKALKPAKHKITDRGEGPSSKKEQVEGQREHKSKNSASKAKKHKCDLLRDKKEHGIVGKEGKVKKDDAGGRLEKKVKDKQSAEKKLKERLFKRKLEKQLFSSKGSGSFSTPALVVCPLFA